MTAGNIRFSEFCSPFVDAKMRQGSVRNGQWLQHAFWKVSEGSGNGACAALLVAQYVHGGARGFVGNLDALIPETHKVDGTNVRPQDLLVQLATLWRL